MGDSAATVAQGEFYEDRYGHLWFAASADVLIEWSPMSVEYVEATRGPLALSKEVRSV